MNGMKNYLVRHGEGDLHDIINEERTKVSYIIQSSYLIQTIYVINKEIWALNPRFIIMSGFKSRAGYNGAHMVDIWLKINIPK